ncbi:MAG TPA: gluconate 2-dehydrogenase subunit 3 family protein [Thermomicrobiales bacterium]|nr:gluconate 2-dehydrogenase subunit 3 family protein [Thermomicrobiales bacterium]
MHDHDSSRWERPAFPRRRLIQGSALLAGASAFRIPLREVAAQATPGATPVGSPIASPVPVAEYVPSSLTTAEYAILRAAVDRIIPADDLGPGAGDAGAQVYIDRALSDRKTASLTSYQQGLKALDTAAGTGGFVALATDKQDEILTTAESGKLADAPDGFFAMLLEDTREGMFSDPVHGGNANFAGWDLMGYPGIKLVWSEQDQQINSTPTPEHISVAKYQQEAGS